MKKRVRSRGRFGTGYKIAAKSGCLPTTHPRSIMIQATTYTPAALRAGEITEQIEYSSERVSARSLLAAVEKLQACGRLSYVPEIEIHGVRFAPSQLHEIAALYYGHACGCRSVQACSDVLAHVAQAPAHA